MEYGFRLPSAFDNRPLKFEEVESKLNQMIFVSATPGDYERQNSTQVAQQVIRPTGLLDPLISVRPVEGRWWICWARSIPASSGTSAFS